MTKGPKWKLERLAITSIHMDGRFQVRAKGTVATNVRKLRRVLEAGQQVEPIKVAKVGKAFYVVDGWHRLEAMTLEGWDAVQAHVAVMTIAGAQRYSLTANAGHGQQMSPADKQVALERYVALGDHLDAHGLPKPSRQIRDELKGGYSHETIRKKLKAMGLEIPKDIEFPDGYKPHPFGFDSRDDDDDFASDLDPLGDMRAAETVGHIEALVPLLCTLSDHDQGWALRALKALVGGLEGGIWPQRLEGWPIDI